MSEFRQDIVTKEWVLIAPSRSGRPDEFKKEPATSQNLPEVVLGCVFCPGGEAQSPAEIYRWPEKGDWQIRLVPNKYGLLEDVEGKAQKNFYVRLPGMGAHEVMITRGHNQPTALQSVQLIEEQLRIYAERIKEFSANQAIKYVHIIQNYGRQGGASLVHPHSQIIAMPFLGPHIQEEIRGSYHHYDLFEQCIYCEMIRHELKVQSRIITETEHFVVMCPFESKLPYQIRIMPKKHRADFSQISAQERGELAAVLKRTLLTLCDKLNNPSYNFYIHTAPFRRSSLATSYEPSYHWHLVILPRINIWAGLELGTEVYVNVMPPEQAADYLRSDEIKNAS
jgi:UDPglucose--hexose-1-phosphate uridylyltransferase